MIQARNYAERPSLGVVNPNKDTILRYMRTGEVDAVAEGYVEDFATGEHVRSLVDEDYVRDGLLWSKEDMYNFEKHDLALNPEFCDAVVALAEAREA